MSRSYARPATEELDVIVIVSTRFGYCHRFRAPKLVCVVDPDDTLTVIGTNLARIDTTYAVYKKDIWAMWSAQDETTGDGLQMEGLNDGEAENEETSDGNLVN